MTKTKGMVFEERCIALNIAEFKQMEQGFNDYLSRLGNFQDKVCRRVNVILQHQLIIKRDHRMYGHVSSKDKHAASQSLGVAYAWTKYGLNEIATSPMIR